MGACTKESAFELLDTFYDLGDNFIDTANTSQAGESERWIGEWMQKSGDHAETSLHTSIRNSLKALLTDYVDIANMYARQNGLRPFSEREFEREVIPMYQAEDMAFKLFGVLGGGYFGSPGKADTGREAQMSKVLDAVATRHNVPITSAPYVFPVLGGRKVEYLKANIKAPSLDLSLEDIQEIESDYDFDLGFPP
ncbi:NADP-dependent oxidoreductase domain-containing protein [Xylaria sp. FL1042]|nr:NADP-dependent oxidoreductase domain-containing protein [Xylaria sp. FL1042]